MRTTGSGAGASSSAASRSSGAAVGAASGTQEAHALDGAHAHHAVRNRVVELAVEDDAGVELHDQLVHVAAAIAVLGPDVGGRAPAQDAGGRRAEAQRAAVD